MSKEKLIKSSSHSPVLAWLATGIMGLGLTACQKVAETAAPVASEAAKVMHDASHQTAEMSAEESAVVATLEWVKTADPQEDAQKAMQKLQGGKAELMAFAGRGITFPGLTADQYEGVKNQVSYEVAEGSGDVIYGETHKALRRNLREYAREYNQVIYNSLAQTP